VKRVAISDMFEIQSSQLALTKQPDADTKPFAEKMVSDHRKTSTELKALVESGKVKAALPAALDSEHETILDELKAKNGKEFDRQYDQIQLPRRLDVGWYFHHRLHCWGGPAAAWGWGYRFPVLSSTPMGADVGRGE
jgi:predicted outer membrane protein